MPGSTLREVAHAAGVSVSTASYALSGKGRVEASTRARVQAVATQLGYAANRSARSLRLGRTGTIGLLLPEYQFSRHGEVLTFDWYARVSASATQAAFRHNLALLLVPAGDDGAPLHVADVDGYIIVDPRHSDRRLDAISGASIPSITIGPDRGNRFGHAVLPNFADSVNQALSELQRNGATRLLTLGVAPGSEWIDATTELVETWCAREGLANMTRTLAHHQTTIKGMHDECRTVVQQALSGAAPPDAIFAVTAGCGAIALSAVTDFGLKVPDDVLIVQDGDEPALMTTTPPITVVDHRPGLLAEIAVDQLWTVLTSSCPEKLPPSTTIASELLRRESTMRILGCSPDGSTAVEGVRARSR